jgi:DNA repair exonuclease SbcCD ATPase subunit
VKILSLEIENILSIEHASLSFEDTGLVLVEGWNHDSARANGAGKTAIFNSLSFGLFDKLPRKVTASEILRRGTSKGKVTVVVQLGDETWTVSRSRPKGVSYSKDKVPQLITQEEWESKLRFNYEQFLLSMYTSQKTEGGFQRFLLCNDSDKKNFLLSLLNLGLFSDCKKNTDDVVKGVLTTVDKLSNSIVNSQSKVDAYSESLINELEVKEEMMLLQQDIEELNKMVLAASSVARPDTAKYNSLEENLYRKQTQIQSARLNRNMYLDSYKRTLAEIADYDKNKACTECGSSLDSADARTAHASHQEKLKATLIEIKAKIDSCDETISKEPSVKELVKKLKEKKEQESSDYLAAQQQVSIYKSTINIKSSRLTNMSLKLQTNVELVNKIKALTSNIEELNKTISNNKKDLEVLKTLSSLFSPTGAQAYVLDSVVDSFNEAVSKYISLLWPNASYSLNSYKENSKGEIVAKFSEQLCMNGKEVSTGSLSGGELRALSLCADFAILDVLKSQFGLSCNPIILDEPFDGLDTVGRELVIELLETLSRNRQIIVVDHASEAKSMFTKTIMVEKRNDVSKVSITT